MLNFTAVGTDMNDKIALILDEMTGKVEGYKQTDLHDYDTLVDESCAEIIQQACYDGKDVYYINGALEVKAKNPEEYGNKLNALNVKLADTQARLKNYVAESAERCAEFDALAEREHALMRDIDEIEKARDEEFKALKLKELAETKFKYYCSICLIIRDENEYLKEWLEWHVGQGVEHFYIYDHGSKQSVAEFLKTLDSSLSSRITVRNFAGKHVFAQRDAYNDCIKRYGKESRWIGFIDADEMVRIKCGKTVSELLRYYEAFAGLFMRWIVYDANGQVKKTDKPMRERFTHVTATDADDGIGKTFVQPLLITCMQTHNCYTHKGFYVVDENRRKVNEAEIRKTDSTDDLVCVDHYYTKSYEEWLEKMRRGSCDPIFNRRYVDFFMYNPDLEYCREDIIIEQKYEVSDK